MSSFGPLPGSSPNSGGSLIGGSSSLSGSNSSVGVSSGILGGGYDVSPQVQTPQPGQGACLLRDINSYMDMNPGWLHVSYLKLTSLRMWYQGNISSRIS